jgi:glycosyltransferase involved in cell wall biosynthesis
MSFKKLKIAIIAPPWLSLYPGCYYGIENVIHYLATNLTERGHHVELFTVGGSTSKVTKLRWYHKEDQYPHILRPAHESLSVTISHMLYSLNIIREAGDFDIIHDHNSFIGPATLAYAVDLPPILHTLHEPFTDKRKLDSGVPDNRLMFEQFKSIRNLYFNAVSEKQKSLAPEGLKPRIERVIYNGINMDEYTYSDKKDDYFTIVASVSPDKGQGTAARACKELGLKLKIAGTIGGQICSTEQMEAELKNPTALSNDRYVTYFKNDVAPYLVPGQIEYIGKIVGAQQKKHFSKAKALLFPIDWEEPFGMALIDALASGTPVIAYNRGAMPEIIEHGVNGFLANNYEEFKEYIGRIDEIDPADCLKSVQDKFSTEIMAENYVKLYRDIIEKHSRVNAKNYLRLAPAKKKAGSGSSSLQKH